MRQLPYVVGPRKYLTLNGLLRAIEKVGGETPTPAIRNDELIVRWPQGEERYKMCERDGAIYFDFQLDVDLRP